MNFKALCFVDMPFGQKPDLKELDAGAPEVGSNASDRLNNSLVDIGKHFHLCRRNSGLLLNLLAPGG